MALLTSAIPAQSIFRPMPPRSFSREISLTLKRSLFKRTDSGWSVGMPIQLPFFGRQNRQVFVCRSDIKYRCPRDKIRSGPQETPPYFKCPRSTPNSFRIANVFRHIDTGPTRVPPPQETRRPSAECTRSNERVPGLSHRRQST